MVTVWGRHTDYETASRTRTDEQWKTFLFLFRELDCIKVIFCYSVRDKTQRIRPQQFHKNQEHLNTTEDIWEIKDPQMLHKVFSKVKISTSSGNLWWFLYAPVRCDRSIKYVLLAANHPKLQSDILGPQKNIYHLWQHMERWPQFVSW